jgi:hypothetical protein
MTSLTLDDCGTDLRLDGFDGDAGQIIELPIDSSLVDLGHEDERAA